MMRRIDARNPSIEGSWTFAGCVISDSTSSTLRLAFYIKRGGIGRVRICRHLTCPQLKCRWSDSPGPALAHRLRNVAFTDGANRFAALQGGYVMATIDCKQRAAETAFRNRPVPAVSDRREYGR